MKLYLEKRPDGTYYFRQTKLVNKKQVVKRISLKTRSVKIAKLLAIQLLAKIQMDKIKKFEVEYDSKGNLIKLNVADEADKQNFMDIQMMMEGHKAALHKRELDRLELEARIDKVKADNEEAKRDKSQDAAKEKIYLKLSQQYGGETLQTLIDTYFEELTVKSIQTHQKYLRIITNFHNFCLSKNIIYLNQFDRKFVKTYIDHLRKEKQKDKNIKNMMGVLTTFFKVQIVNGETTNPDPFTGHNFDIDDEEGRLPFSIEELIKIFNTDFVKNNQQNKFILMLLLTTGARPNEICQLMAHDIYKETIEDICIIDINDDGYEKTLKNRVSRRKIYLHQLLIDHGFLEYLDTRKNKRLFDLSKPTDKNFSVSISEDFSEILRNELEIKVKVLYCFRHTANNRLKQSLVNKEIREDLLGHTPEGENAKTYTKKFSPVMLKNATQEFLFFREVRFQ